MKVTIRGINERMKFDERYEGVDYDIVSFKEIHKRNGVILKKVMIENGKRHIVFSSGIFDTITVQDEESGRYIFKLEK